LFYIIDRHYDEIKKESDSDDENTTAETTDMFEESDDMDEIVWPPSSAHDACKYMYNILKASKENNNDLCDILLEHLNMVKDNDDYPVKTRIALVRLIGKFKKKSTSSPTLNVDERASTPGSETTEIQDNPNTLAVYQTKDSVMENFPSHKDYLSNVVPSEQFKDQFEELIDLANNEKQWLALSFILRAWYKDKQNQEFLETLLLSLMKALIGKDTKESVLLEIALEQFELLSEEKGNELVKTLEESGKDLLACKLALQVKHRSTNLLAIEIIKTIAERKHELLKSKDMSEIVTSCILNGYTSNLLSIEPVLQSIVSIPLPRDCEAQLVAELVLNGFKQDKKNLVLCACQFVTRQVFGMHEMFCDLNGSLFLLRRYLQQQQTATIQNDEIVIDLCRAALKKLKQ